MGHNDRIDTAPALHHSGLQVSSIQLPQRKIYAEVGTTYHTLVDNLQFLFTLFVYCILASPLLADFPLQSVVGKVMSLQMKKKCQYCVHIMLSDTLCKDLNLTSSKGNC